MRRTGRRTLDLVLALSALLGGISAGIPPIVHAVESYKVQAFPFYSQEGSTILLILTVSSSNPSTSYRFDFIVQDPSKTNCTSTVQYNTGPTETEFSININFPGPGFSGSCSPTALTQT